MNIKCQTSKRRGRWPTAELGDASRYFDLPPGTVSWRQVEEQLRRKGTSLVKLGEDLGYLERAADADAEPSNV